MWPPLYTIRKSARARHIRLKISRHRGLEIIIPQHSKQYDVITLLNAHRSWIEKKGYPWQPNSVDHQLPQQLNLLAIEKSWRITYQPTAQPIQLCEDQDALLLTGSGPYKPALKQWLKQQAHFHLTPLLANISQEIGLTYNRISIRLQSTRWGSCSRLKNISLNAKLLFLPQTLVRHVLIHELCHTVHLNHSKKFWALAASFEQDHQYTKRELTKAEQYIPTWIER